MFSRAEHATGRCPPQRILRVPRLGERCCAHATNCRQHSLSRILVQKTATVEQESPILRPSVAPLPPRARRAPWPQSLPRPGNSNAPRQAWRALAWRFGAGQTRAEMERRAGEGAGQERCMVAWSSKVFQPIYKIQFTIWVETPCLTLRPCFSLLPLANGTPDTMLVFMLLPMPAPRAPAGIV